MKKNKTAEKPAKKRKTVKVDRVKQIELKYLPKMYDAWCKVQGLMNDLDAELNLRKQPKELMHFDFACSHMEQAFNKLEDEIANRKDSE